MDKKDPNGIAKEKSLDVKPKKKTTNEIELN